MLKLNEDMVVPKKQGTWDFSDDEFSLFAEFIEQHSGLVFDDYKKDSLRISLTTRISLTRLQTFEDYYRLLNDPMRGPQEFRQLLSLITINETSFFRNPEQYSVLKKYVLPSIAGRKLHEEGGEKTIRIWSAGCSTGEEPYSLAMVLLESGYIEQGLNVKILATDVSEQALESARKGLYRRRALVNMTQGQIDNFLVRQGEEYQVSEEVMNLVEFDYFNLIRIPFPLQRVKGMDIIFCKNVTIYFKMESTKRVIQSFYEALDDCGYLFIGHSETLWGLSDKFGTIEKEGAFFYLKGTEKDGCLLPRKWSKPSDRRERKPEERQPSTSKASTDYPWQRTAPSEPSQSNPKSGPAAEAKQATSISIEQCENFYKAGQYGEALGALGQLMENEPRNVRAHMLIAYISANQEDYSKAKTACYDAIDIDPGQANAYLLLGTIYGKFDQYDKALTNLKKAVYNDPLLAEAYLQMATIHKQLGQSEKAILAYENAIHCLEKHAVGLAEDPDREVSHKILLDLCRGNIELLRSKKSF